jgi:hypothetical protein
MFFKKKISAEEMAALILGRYFGHQPVLERWSSLFSGDRRFMQDDRNFTIFLNEMIAAHLQLSTASMAVVVRDFSIYTRMLLKIDEILTIEERVDIILLKNRYNQSYGTSTNGIGQMAELFAQKCNFYQDSHYMEAYARAVFVESFGGLVEFMKSVKIA